MFRISALLYCLSSLGQMQLSAPTVDHLVHHFWVFFASHHPSRDLASDQMNALCAKLVLSKPLSKLVLPPTILFRELAQISLSLSLSLSLFLAVGGMNSGPHTC
jgi:hypothetical protein